VTVAFVLSDVSITVAQAATVALPKNPRLPALAALRSRWWAVVPPLTIAGFVLLVHVRPSAAQALSYAALIGLPPLAAFALARGIRPSSARSALLVGPLFALAWAAPHSLSGQAAALVLSTLAAVALAVLLTQLVPVGWLMGGMVLMAALDAVLLAGHLLQPADHLLRVAAPADGLPKLQSTVFGSAVCGFGDLFIAALFGALLAAGRRQQIGAALLTLGLSIAFDGLFFVAHDLPATVPVAAAMLLVEARRRFSTRRRVVVEAIAPAAARPAPAPASAS
jgi:hypothetical protein